MMPPIDTALLRHTAEKYRLKSAAERAIPRPQGSVAAALLRMAAATGRFLVRCSGIRRATGAAPRAGLNRAVRN